jgi:hypothetical protein
MYPIGKTEINGVLRIQQQEPAKAPFVAKLGGLQPLKEPTGFIGHWSSNVSAL